MIPLLIKGASMLKGKNAKVGGKQINFGNVLKKGTDILNTYNAGKNSQSVKGQIQRLKQKSVPAAVVTPTVTLVPPSQVYTPPQTLPVYTPPLPALVDTYDFFGTPVKKSTAHIVGSLALLAGASYVGYRILR